MDMQRENGTTWADGKSQQPTQVKKEVAGNNLIKKKNIDYQMKFLIHIVLLSSAIHPLYETTKMEHMLLTIFIFTGKCWETTEIAM